MGSMLDELEESKGRVGRICFFQRILEEEGQEVYDEMMEVVTADASVARKHRVFVNRGYHVGMTTVGNHFRGDCLQCQ